MSVSMKKMHSKQKHTFKNGTKCKIENRSTISKKRRFDYEDTNADSEMKKPNMSIEEAWKEAQEYAINEEKNYKKSKKNINRFDEIRYEIFL
jgi:hypothetical protein